MSLDETDLNIVLTLLRLMINTDERFVIFFIIQRHFLYINLSTIFIADFDPIIDGKSWLNYVEFLWEKRIVNNFQWLRFYFCTLHGKDGGSSSVRILKWWKSIFNVQSCTVDHSRFGIFFIVMILKQWQWTERVLTIGHSINKFVIRIRIVTIFYNVESQEI